MTIKNKLLLSFISMIVVFSTLSVYLVVELKKQGELTVFAFNQPLSAVNSSRSAGDIFIKADQYAKNILQMSQPYEKKQVAEKFGVYVSQFEHQLSIARKNSFSPEMAQQVDKVDEIANRWFTDTLQYIASEGQGQLVSTIRLSEERELIAHHLDELVSNTINEANVRANEVESTADEHFVAILVLLAGIGVTSLIAAVWITSKLVKPINGLIDAVIELSRGDGDLTKRLNHQGNDEISLLSKEFNEFIKKVHITVTEISQSVSSTKQRLVDFSDIAVETQQGTLQQKSEIDNISSAMEQVNSSMNTVDESSSQVKQQADEIHEETKVSVELVQQAVDEISSLNENMESTSDVIFSLSKSSAEIGDVLNVIETIADQTNLLALNAAIEAARAGESGRGFSVVAEEIRNLAMKTQESTTDIHRTITTIQQQAQEAKSMMESGTERAHSCVDKNNDVSKALNQVLERVVAIMDRSEFVSEQTHHQKEATVHVNGYLTQIIEIAEQTAQGSKLLDNHSTEVIASMGEVNHKVAQFRL